MPPNLHVRNILGDLLDTAVDLGGFLVPAQALESHLGRFCQHLLVWTHDETHKLQLVGSSLPVKYRGHYFLLCSKHQLTDVDPEDVCIMYPDGSSVVTSSGVRVCGEMVRGGETDAYDIAAFDFTETLKSHPTLKPLFFCFDHVPPDVTSDKVVALIIAGFATTDQVYDIEDNNHLGSVKRNLTARPDGQPTDKSLMRGKYVEPLGFSPDGLSGAPVFVVQWAKNGQPRAYLGGLMLRSGRETFHFLKSGYVKGFLDSFLGHECNRGT